MRQITATRPLKPTAPYKEGDGSVEVRPNEAMKGLRDGVIYHCKTSLGAISVRLPASGNITVGDADGSAATTNVLVYPAPNHSIMDGTPGEAFAIDINNFYGTFSKQPNSSVWSVI